jgi:hypothetical protein
MISTTGTSIDARDKPALLRAMMRELAGDAQISFEGTLENLDFSQVGEVIDEADSYLLRQTSSPTLDYVILPLTFESVDVIWRELSAKDHLARDGVIHTQIGKHGELAFGAYDNFHRKCVWASGAVSARCLGELKSRGVIRDFEAIE